MSTFIYFIAEGVTDVTVLKKVLERGWDYTQVKLLADLPKYAKNIFGSYKFPNSDDITRLSVPAPIFLQGPNEVLLMLCNAEGLEKIEGKMKADKGRFERNELWPDRAAIMLDRDDKDQNERFNKSAALLPLVITSGLRPENLNQVKCDGTERVGVFSFPGSGEPGALENVLIPFGQRKFPDLFKDASDYVARAGQCKVDLKEYKKPQGNNKAILSSMAAILKPGKNLNASLEDQWITADVKTDAAFQPLLKFLADLLA